jgi:acylphosphatase
LKNKEVRLEVYGRVQGVNFRNNTLIFANSLGLNGEVMNREDGSVLIIAQGSEEKLKSLIEWAKENPGLSRVDSIKELWGEGDKKYSGFKIVREASFLKDQKKALGNLGRSIINKL